MKKLTKREILLIYILIILIIIMGGWFLLLNPALQRSHKLAQQLDQVSMQVDSMKLSDMELSDKEVATATKEYENVKTNFNELLTLEQIDEKLTALILKYRFEPISLNMEPIKKEEVKPFNLSDKKSEETKSPKIFVAKVAMEIEGTYQQLAPLVGEVKELPGIKITAFSQTNESDRISIDFNCYMVK
ncbi:MAG: hypothetical protein RSF69_03195 [Erysipelotrichaceae bacterium]